MRKFFSAKVLVVVVIILLACFASMIYSIANPGAQTPVTKAVGVITTPIQNGITKIANKVTDAYNYLFEYNSYKEENLELRKQIREMQQKLRDADVALDENARLRSLLSIKERNRSFVFEVAEVTGRNVGNWSTTITIGKGSVAGVEENDCVITTDGMVGFVSSVGPTYAEVTTIIDLDMQAAAIVTRTREIVVAEGEYEVMSDGFLKLSYITKDSGIVIGDTVETSGSGGIFPKGIMIGTVEKIISEKNGITNYAIVRPFINVDSVKNVFVIKDFEISE